jgi:translation initiation factor 2 beta subunit (eIF-2beta)/eIF-5
MQFWNRLTKSITTKLPDQIILGQWQVITESERVLINTFELATNSREYIFPDSSHRWSIRSIDSKLHHEKQFPIWQLPSDILFESLRFFDGALQKLLSNSATWVDWVNVPPLVPEIEQKINIQPLEVITKQNLGHLEEICHRPRTYLKLETERLPVSRAQRISPHAAEFLAAHTEDWERRKFSSVVPRRVLCMVREELWDIYENKVTVRLIDHLLRYVSQRVQQVQTLKRQLEEAEYLSGTTSDIHWRNQERIYTLWGNHVDATTALKKAESTLRELQQLQYKLRSLIDTDLYKAIPLRAAVGTTLKRTNILVNDQHYCYVDLLWREWSRCQSGQIKNSRQIFEENQQLFRGFESFCLLLIGLALTGSGSSEDKGLGFQPLVNLIPTRGSQSIQFRGILGEVSLTWEEDGSFLLQSRGIKDLRVIPIVATLTATNNSEIITSSLKTLFHNLTPNTENQTLILYPSTQEQRKKLPLYIQRQINTLGNDYPPEELIPAILPVSPLDIFSVEKIARAIQWWLNGQQYLLYPPTIGTNIPDALLQDANWLKKENQSNQVRVLRLPLPAEEQSFKTNLQSHINQLQARGSKGKGQLIQQQPLENENLPSQANELIQPFQICPICHSTGSLTALDNQCFRCECSRCGSDWGTRTCGNCGKKYPYIQITGIKSQNRHMESIERTLGREVLAVPCSMESNYGTFICSHCGKCSQAQQKHLTGCIRCQCQESGVKNLLYS